MGLFEHAPTDFTYSEDPMPYDLTWIEVNVSNGAFSSELAVAINTPEGDISLFADRSIVKHEDGKDFLRVTCMGQDAETGEDIVLLPTECFETGSRWLRVKRDAA